jgi:hypothetical protein
VWDDGIIEDQGLSEKKYLARLVREIDDNHWERLAGGAPSAWADVSHHYAVEAELPSGGLITHAYVVEEAKIVDAQLALGGLRLARVLNRILGTQDNPQPERPLLPKATTVPAPNGPP